MDNLTNQIDNIILQIEEVTNFLYRQDTKTAYEKLNGVLVGISGVISKIFEMRDQNNNPKYSIQSLEGKLSGALQAMQSKDIVLLADILQYDVAEELKEIREEL